MDSSNLSQRENFAAHTQFLFLKMMNGDEPFQNATEGVKLQPPIFRLELRFGSSKCASRKQPIGWPPMQTYIL